MTFILDELGIFGVNNSTEVSVLCALLTGDPCLLIGVPGTAKTDLVETIGAALRFYTENKYGKESGKVVRYQVYDVSKIEYEDLLGIPNPASMKEGKMEYIETPITIWGKTLVGLDEINRAKPDRQSNLLELIRSRKVQGIPTGTKWIFAMMNPLGDSGTETMSRALVDRFATYNTITPYIRISDSDARLSIVSKIGSSDSVALQSSSSLDSKYSVRTKSGRKNLAKIGEKIASLISRAREYYSMVEEELGESMTVFVDSCVLQLHDQNLVKDISGRRAGMIRRNCVASRAVELAIKEMDRDYDLPPIEESVADRVALSLPIGVSSELSGLSPDKYLSIKEKCKEIFASTVGPAMVNVNAGTVLSCYTEYSAFSSFLHDVVPFVPGTERVTTVFATSVVPLLNKLPRYGEDTLEGGIPFVGSIMVHCASVIHNAFHGSGDKLAKDLMSFSALFRGVNRTYVKECVSGIESILSDENIPPSEAIKYIVSKVKAVPADSSEGIVTKIETTSVRLSLPTITGLMKKTRDIEDRIQWIYSSVRNLMKDPGKNRDAYLASLLWMSLCVVLFGYRNDKVSVSQEEREIFINELGDSVMNISGLLGKLYGMEEKVGSGA